MSSKHKVTLYIAPDVARALRIASADKGIPQGVIAEAALRAALMGGDASELARDTLDAGPAAALDVATELRDDGDTLAAIAAELNRRGYRTNRGKRWSTVSVSRLLKR